jgi:tRNA-Thr(GGU) m(6)t(6)A37 methyltransferase TsaA
MAEITFKSIGTYHSSQIHPYDAGRQPDSLHAEGLIKLESGQNFEQALTGLSGCKKIWVIFLFHHNEHWNPMVLPPRGGNTKQGVFATRSPYRPNPIGMSCVDLVSIEGLNLKISGADLLDGSPILDIKPYLAYADSFPEVMPNWLIGASPYKISFSERSEEQLSWLEQNGLVQLRSFIVHQLEYEPTNGKKKRVKQTETSFILSYRTWRVCFQVLEQEITIENIFSGYSVEDLNEQSDIYSDKDLHRNFKQRNQK